MCKQSDSSRIPFFPTWPSLEGMGGGCVSFCTVPISSCGLLVFGSLPSDGSHQEDPRGCSFLGACRMRWIGQSRRPRPGRGRHGENSSPRSRFASMSRVPRAKAPPRGGEDCQGARSRPPLGGACLGLSGAVWGCLALSGAVWGCVGPLWGCLGAAWGCLGLSGASLGLPGGCLGLSGPLRPQGGRRVTTTGGARDNHRAGKGPQQRGGE